MVVFIIGWTAFYFSFSIQYANYKIIVSPAKLLNWNRGDLKEIAWHLQKIN